jgi:hypothetical protein
MISVLLALAISQAPSFPAEPIQKKEAFQQIGSSYQTAVQLAVSASAKYVVRRGAGDGGMVASTPACAPVGSRLVFTTAGGGAVVHLTMNATVAFPSDYGTNYFNRVTDAAGPSGRATGPILPISGSVAEERVDFDVLYNAPGGKIKGICANQILCMGTRSWVPCRANSDCTTWGAGSTCTAASNDTLNNLRSNGGFAIVFQADTANTILTVTRQR